ncbi:MAG: symmetrical bis(5'-nucleosyl)-tetraphosphatase [Gammaproteobacteria bacterium WSBS_2016_MAG_OTU1]
MATYAIGDIHGCRQTLGALLSRIAFSPATDELWLTGDLVNRGTDSLGVLRWAFENRDNIRIVLGNHDLHLLAAHAGAITLPLTSPLQAILQAEDADILCEWLKAQPLLYAKGEYVLLHAGRMPEWGERQAADIALEAGERLRQGDFFAAMYGDLPARWHSALSGDARHRVAINAFSRLRLLSADGSIVLPYSGRPQERPPQTVPWFDYYPRIEWSSTIVCGHWSALGLLLRRDIMAIDTGCLWSGMLTAICLEDHKLYQEPAHPADIVK